MVPVRWQDDITCRGRGPLLPLFDPVLVTSKHRRLEQKWGSLYNVWRACEPDRAGPWTINERHRRGRCGPDIELGGRWYLDDPTTPAVIRSRFVKAMVEGDREQGIMKTPEGSEMSGLRMFNTSISTPMMWVSPSCASTNHAARKGCFRKSVVDNMSEPEARGGKRLKLESKRVSFAFFSVTRNYMVTDVHASHKDGNPTENEGLQDIQCIRRIESEIEEDVLCTYDKLSETKKKDGPSMPSLIVNNLVKGVVERKVLETRKVLECIQETVARANEMYNHESDQGEDPFEKQHDSFWGNASDKSISDASRYLSCSLLKTLAAKMNQMILAIQTQGKVGLLPSQARLDKSFVPPLQFLIMHLDTVMSTGGRDSSSLQNLCTPHITLHNNANILNC
eukprot:765395-Hanusia_phi.AAC.1